MQARHKLAIKEYIEKSNFDISLFEFESNDKFRIKLAHSELRFEIIQDPKDFNKFFTYQTLYKPDYPLFGPLGTNNLISNVQVQIGSWLNSVVKPYLEEMELSEKWDAFESNNFFEGAFNTNNDDLTYLTPSEVNFLENAFSQIKNEIRNEFEPTKELMQSIDTKLTYLINSTDRLNRFDLKGAILNTLISIVINLGVDTESGKTLYRIFKDAFNSIPVLFETTNMILKSNFGGQ